jgi:hypothetical protein
MDKTNKQTQTPPLPEYFRAESYKNQWRLFCKKCNKGWALNKDNCHPGNILHLLNHAYSHKD